MSEATLEHMLACVERSKLLEPLMAEAYAKLQEPTCTMEDFKRYGDLHSMAHGELPMPESLA